MENKKKAKVNKRTIVYIAIIGGLAIASLVMFGVSQYNKSKYTASNTVLMGAENTLTEVYKQDPNALTDESSPLHDKALWYNDIKEHFTTESSNLYNVYNVTAIVAYSLSLATLVAFGFVLKHADYVKEKEEKVIA